MANTDDARRHLGNAMAELVHLEAALGPGYRVFLVSDAGERFEVPTGIEDDSLTPRECSHDSSRPYAPSPRSIQQWPSSSYAIQHSWPSIVPAI